MSWLESVFDITVQEIGCGLEALELEHESMGLEYGANCVHRALDDVEESAGH
jgi:hypothetical protein